MYILSNDIITHVIISISRQDDEVPSGNRSLFEIPSSVLAERPSGGQAPPVSEGLGDKMLTRVFSPACWSQTDRGEVTRRNLRQPTSTWTRSKNQTRSPRTLLCFALLWFTLLGFALHEQPERAPEGSVFYTRQDAP